MKFEVVTPKGSAVVRGAGDDEAVWAGGGVEARDMMRLVLLALRLQLAPVLDHIRPVAEDLDPGERFIE